MKYVRFQAEHGQINLGILKNGKIQKLEGDFFEEGKVVDEEYDLNCVRLLAPICPGKIIGIGANYRSFLDANKRDYPLRPKLFVKPSTTVIGDHDSILCPDSNHKICFEGEIGVVIRRKCSCISAENAKDYIFGYTCINDVTDRTMLEEDGIWDRGKGLDTFLPMGPCIEDEVDGMDVMLETRVNGTVRQHMSTSDMYFGIPELLAYISRHITLCPGDVIATGTPNGAGAFHIGDVVEIEIEGIGVLTNKMIERGVL